MNIVECKNHYLELKPCEKFIESIEPSFFFEFAETLLNELEKKENEIKRLEYTLAENLAREVNSTIKSSQKAKEDLAMLDEGWKLELEKQDKVIEEILKVWKQDDIRSVEELKEYFYKKVEG